MSRRSKPTPGARIKQWREKRGLSLRELAAKADLYASQLHRFEHGQQEPRAVEIEAIAEALKLSMAEFYGEAAA